MSLDSLRPGEKWEPRLLSEIDQCDLFVLFWSKAARESKWVNKEIAYALERIGKQTPPKSARPDIQPILIEGPPPPKPPNSLRSLHFNDRFLYMIAAIENRPRLRPRPEVFPRVKRKSLRKNRIALCLSDGELGPRKFNLTYVGVYKIERPTKDFSSFSCATH